MSAAAAGARGMWWIGVRFLFDEKQRKQDANTLPSWRRKRPGAQAVQDEIESVVKEVWNGTDVLDGVQSQLCLFVVTR